MFANSSVLNEKHTIGKLIDRINLTATDISHEIS